MENWSLLFFLTSLEVIGIDLTPKSFQKALMSFFRLLPPFSTQSLVPNSPQLLSGSGSSGFDPLLKLSYAYLRVLAHFTTPEVLVMVVGLSK